MRVTIVEVAPTPQSWRGLVRAFFGGVPVRLGLTTPTESGDTTVVGYCVALDFSSSLSSSLPSSPDVRILVSDTDPRSPEYALDSALLDSLCGCGRDCDVENENSTQVLRRDLV